MFGPKVCNLNMPSSGEVIHKASYDHLKFKWGTTTLSIMDLIVTLSIMTLGTSLMSHYAECRYAVCRVSFFVTLNVIMLIVVMLSVVAPLSGRSKMYWVYRNF